MQKMEREAKNIFPSRRAAILKYLFVNFHVFKFFVSITEKNLQTKIQKWSLL